MNDKLMWVAGTIGAIAMGVGMNWILFPPSPPQKSELFSDLSNSRQVKETPQQVQDQPEEKIKVKKILGPIKPKMAPKPQDNSNSVSFHVTGTIVGEGRGSSFAFIRLSDGNQGSFGVGQVVEGAEIKSIHAHHIMVAMGGKTQRVGLTTQSFAAVKGKSKPGKVNVRRVPGNNNGQGTNGEDKKKNENKPPQDETREERVKRYTEMWMDKLRREDPEGHAIAQKWRAKMEEIRELRATDPDKAREQMREVWQEARTNPKVMELYRGARDFMRKQWEQEQAKRKKKGGGGRR